MLPCKRQHPTDGPLPADPKTSSENRKNGLLVSIRSSDRSKVIVSASTKHILSLLDDDKKGKGNNKSSNKRQRKNNPPPAQATSTATSSSLLSLKNSGGVVPRAAVKNVFDMPTLASLPDQSVRRPTTQPLGAVKPPPQGSNNKSQPRNKSTASISSSSTFLTSGAISLSKKSIAQSTLPKRAPEAQTSQSLSSLLPPPRPTSSSSRAAALSSLPKSTMSSLLSSTPRIGLTGLSHSKARTHTQASSRIVDRQSAPKDPPPPAAAAAENPQQERVAVPSDSVASLVSQPDNVMPPALSSFVNTTVSRSSSECPPLSSATTSSSLLSSTHDVYPSSRLQSVLEIPKIGSEESGPSKAKKSSSTGNFVRLNLKNNSGSCRGRRRPPKKNARNYSGSSSYSSSTQKDYSGMAVGKLERTQRSIPQEAFFSTNDLMDPVDDFLDGVYTATTITSSSKQQKQQKRSTAAASTQQIPSCRVHQRPCKLCTVKKTGNNKGRQFWACSLPRGEQCQHFQWAEDSQQAAREALLRNQNTSGFIARQVASYMQALSLWTVPELRDWMTSQGISFAAEKKTKAANKHQLKTRIAIWVRDQVANSVPEREKEAQDKEDLSEEAAVEPENDDDDSCSKESSDDEDDGSSTTSSNCSEEEELEFLGPQKKDDQPANHRLNEGVPCLLETERYDSDGDEADEQYPTCKAATKAVTPCPLKAALEALFGYTRFREGQEWAIKRCLDNKRTLLVAPTGFGKSLCYALPAALKKDGICIVVSPLLSLIQDQLRMLPPRLPAATLSGSLTTAAMASTLDDIIRGRIKIVFVSPERLSSPSFRRMFQPTWNATTNSYQRKFPPVSLLCVDESHCLSSWGLNFRPSFIRVGTLLGVIQPEAVLAITATAGPRVITDICQFLGIDQSYSVSSAPSDEDSGVLVLKTNRDNIDVSTFVLSTQEERLAALISILSSPTASRNKTAKSKVPKGCLASGSVIVYVWRQRDAEVVAENIQASSVTGGVVVYHGGMKSGDREKAQSKFMRGKARICVATVAFGLGINKSDVRGVIHLSLASSAENYLQEIGRAGRDGSPARAVALILQDEVLVRHSLAHSDLICKSQTRCVFQYLCNAAKVTMSLLPQERQGSDPVNIGLSLSKISSGCDCKPETVETLMSLLELNNREEPLLFVEGISYDRVTIAPKRRHLTDLAEKEPLARAVLACGTCVEAPAGESHSAHQQATVGRGNSLVGCSFGSYAFSVANCASLLGPTAEPRHVFAVLRRLEKTGDIELALDTSSAGKVLILKVTCAGLTALSDADEEALDLLTMQIHERLTRTVEESARKTLELNHIMLEVSRVSTDESKEVGKKSKSLTRFQQLIQAYFEEGDKDSPSTLEQPRFLDLPSKHELSNCISTVFSYIAALEAAVANLDETALHLGKPTSVDYTALVITKFLHGLVASRFSPALLRNNHMFGRMQGTQFTLLEQAVKELL